MPIRRHPGRMVALVAPLLLPACSSPDSGPPPEAPAEEVFVPGALLPGLTTSPGGEVILSWVDESDGLTRLRHAAWTKNGLESARTIASGSDWFVNWADVPSVTRSGNGTLAAHWLQRNGEGTYAYGVRLAVSTDAGSTWTEPTIPHEPVTETEHGFVTLLPSDTRFDVFWLDGRNYAEGNPAMTIRHAELGPNGTAGPETVLDARVCDCCPTAAVRTGHGTRLVFYRDRSEDEVRDISYVSQRNGRWSAPRPIHRDAWKIAGCPVNGPAAATRAEQTVCAWYTEGADGAPRVSVARSTDDGDSFDDPVRVDDGAPIGRVAVALLRDGTAVVAWLEAVGESAELRVRAVSADGLPAATHTMASLPASRATGYPRMVAHGDGVIMAWTDPRQEGGVHLRSVRVSKLQ